ncbi:proline dehydrogenase family protein, partial [Vibrio parahaemolyticus VPTS-2010]
RLLRVTLWLLNRLNKPA